ncbi:MAG: hypothetical protein Q8Q52_07835 [Acidimicrobiia bacterium]|nr:hypothetical protein [Acidimicrobiia bacterium]
MIGREGDRVVVRLTYTGMLGEMEPTDVRVEMVGAGLFTSTGGLIAEAFGIGDTQAFWRALGRL